jgi:hypothetical protein
VDNVPFIEQTAIYKVGSESSDNGFDVTVMGM